MHTRHDAVRVTRLAELVRVLVAHPIRSATVDEVQARHAELRDAVDLKDHGEGVCEQNTLESINLPNAVLDNLVQPKL